MMKPPSVRITHRVDNPVLIMPKEGTARLSRGDAGLESAVDCAISSPSLPASSCPDCHARHQHQKQPWNENCKQARECNLLPLPVRVNGNLRATGTAKNCAAFLGRWRGRGRRRATCIKLHSVTPSLTYPPPFAAQHSRESPDFPSCRNFVGTLMLKNLCGRLISRRRRTGEVGSTSHTIPWTARYLFCTQTNRQGHQEFSTSTTRDLGPTEGLKVEGRGERQKLAPSLPSTAGGRQKSPL